MKHYDEYLKLINFHSNFQAILAEKLKYAIVFCKSIDTDEYARVALAEQTDQTASENHSDIGSEVSEDI